MRNATYVEHLASSKIGQRYCEQVETADALQDGMGHVDAMLVIGTHRFGSTIRWVELLSPKLLITLSLPNQMADTDAKLIRTWMEDKGTDWVQIIATSDDPKALEIIRETLGAFRYPLDFLFIDGDHSYGGALSDYRIHAPQVRVGGYIGFHDTVLFPPVGDLWRELELACPGDTQSFVADVDPIGIGLLRVGTSLPWEFVPDKGPVAVTPDEAPLVPETEEVEELLDYQLGV